MPIPNPRLVRSVVVALLVVIGVVLVAVEVRGHLRDRHERLGEVTVTDCSFKTFSQHGSVYDCHGSFESDDGDLVIADVRFEHQGSVATAERVRATLAGPGVGELIHAATVAVAGQVPLDLLWHAVPSYPTISEIWLRLLEAYGL